MYIKIIFIDKEAAKLPLEILKESKVKCIKELKKYFNKNDLKYYPTVQKYKTEKTDKVFIWKQYVLVYNFDLGYVNLYKEK
ncbi:MAG: hypothetical protein K9K32_00025 [Halanaerobiales bacterium]|nr:hypothetical protein [Halanaerobiales bacterium]